jgi:hypothetical protein
MERQRAANYSSEKARQFHRSILLSRLGAVKLFVDLAHAESVARIYLANLFPIHVWFLALPL